MDFIQEQDMDRGGMKYSNNQDERVNFGNSNGRAFQGEGSGLAAPAAPQSILGDVSNGVGKGGTPREELTTAVSASMGLYTEDPDAKALGVGGSPQLQKQQPQQPQQPQQQQQQQQQHALGSFSLGENFSLLEASIANLNRCSTTMDPLTGLGVGLGVGVGGGSEPFQLKMEGFSPAGKDRLDMEPEPFGQAGKEQDLNARLFTENSLDILRDLELPGSLTDLNEFYVGDEAAFLSSLSVDEALMGDVGPLKETKPVVSGNGGIAGLCGGGGGVNGSEQQQQQQAAQEAAAAAGLLPVIKKEKDSFIQLCTPGVIKQEKESRSYCQMGGTDLSSPLHSPISVCGVSTSGGQSYHYGVSSPPAVGLPDQKPVFGLYPPLGADGWGRPKGYGDPADMGRGGELVSISQAFPGGYIRHVVSTAERGVKLWPGSRDLRAPVTYLLLPPFPRLLFRLGVFIPSSRTGR